MHELEISKLQPLRLVYTHGKLADCIMEAQLLDGLLWNSVLNMHMPLMACLHTQLTRMTLSFQLAYAYIRSAFPSILAEQSDCAHGHDISERPARSPNC